MNKEFKINFDKSKAFELKNIDQYYKVIGLYFIFSPKTEIRYPFKKSRLLYIGMSEKKTNSISSRLAGHFDGKSRNQGLVNYRKVSGLEFTVINFEMMRRFWSFTIEELESYFIRDFVESYGVYPICNNKTGTDILSKKLTSSFIIDWQYFE